MVTPPKERGSDGEGGSLPHEVRNDVHGQREDDGGVLLCCDGVESLQVAQLQGRRGLRDHQGRLLQGAGRVHLALGCDHLQTDTGGGRGWWVTRGNGCFLHVRA